MDLSFDGIGLHSGERCTVAIQLGGEEGLVFQTASGRLRASASAVHSTELSTALREGAVSVLTVEHLLSALTALGHFSASVAVSGPEIPILDGSALPFASALPLASGPCSAPLSVLEPFELALDSARVRVSPAPTLLVDYRIDFPNAAIGAQRLQYRHSPQAYRSQIAPARTFTTLAAVEAARRRGLIRGGSLECAVVFDEHGPVNPPLRFADEPVRHKVLDLLGDLALLGRPLLACIEIERGGHALHAALVRELACRLRHDDGRVALGAYFSNGK